MSDIVYWDGEDTKIEKRREWADGRRIRIGGEEKNE
jgi:hypothetical protein